MERVRVDPSRFELDQHDECTSLLQDSGIEHDPQWVAKVCEQVQKHRFALIRLPQRHARIYWMLVQPQTYPEIVRNGNLMREHLKTGGAFGPLLPEELIQLSKAWVAICEHICKQVTERLRSIVASSVAPDASVHRQVHGLLRISFNSSAGQHLDNGHVTFMGTGNTKGALHFGNIQPEGRANYENDSAEGDAGDVFTACEEFIQSDDDDDADATNFLLFVGVRLASPPTLKPLLHRVEYDSDGVDRINAIYFLREFNVSRRETSRTNFEIHAFNKTILTDTKFIECNVEDTADHELANLGKDAHATDVAEDKSDLSSEAGVDWSSDWVTT